jgi:hypothetical protein
VGPDQRERRIRGRWWSLLKQEEQLTEAMERNQVMKGRMLWIFKLTLLILSIQNCRKSGNNLVVFRS